MPYHKLKYPTRCPLWRFPNGPGPGVGPFSYLDCLLAWYPKFLGFGGAGLGAGSQPIVIIAFPLGVVLVDSFNLAVGGDVVQVPDSPFDYYTILATSERFRGFPNQTGLASAIKGVVWPGGVPG